MLQYLGVLGEPEVTSMDRYIGDRARHDVYPVDFERAQEIRDSSRKIFRERQRQRWPEGTLGPRVKGVRFVATLDELLARRSDDSSPESTS